MDALLVVDIQNDFCPGGALAIPEGDKIIPVINKLILEFDHVLQTQDWHCLDDSSFASSHEGKEPYETINMYYGEQILWPDHCVQGSRGANFHKDLNTTKTELIIRKGFHQEIDSYSAFFENDHQTMTGLTGYLRERGISRIYIAGLATDFCVKWSAVDGTNQGFEIVVIEDAVRGIDIDGSVAAAWEEMEQKGIKKIHSNEILSDLD
jgi:nicotinamidase/pyrazinamidase